MNRKAKKTSPIELIDITFEDIVNEFCKEFDLPPITIAKVLLSVDDTIARMAVQVAFDVGVYFGKTRPDKVAITLPSPHAPLPSVPSPDDGRTQYVG